VGDNSDSLELLAVVAAVHHEGVGQSLDDGAVGLAESLDSEATSGVGDVDGVAEGDVVTVGLNPSVFAPSLRVFESQRVRMRRT
jgi:hypothetical protein